MAFLGNTIDYLLHLHASDSLFKRAKELRKEMTEAETILWNELKNRKLNGFKFRRQHPLHLYVADFYCHEKRLVIEVDGGIHNKRKVFEHDQNRSAELDRLGIRVIRVSNEEVILSIQDVINKIKDELKK